MNGLVFRSYLVCLRAWNGYVKQGTPKSRKSYLQNTIRLLNTCSNAFSTTCRLINNQLLFDFFKGHLANVSQVYLRARMALTLENKYSYI